MICKSCGYDIKSGKKFCGKCGAPAPQMVSPPLKIDLGAICLNCKKAISNDTVFCPHCGTKAEAKTPDIVKNEDNDICESCGVPIIDNAPFCGKCGARVLNRVSSVPLGVGTNNQAKKPQPSKVKRGMVEKPLATRAHEKATFIPIKTMLTMETDDGPQTYPLPVGKTRIGRSQTNEIVLTDELASRHHLIIENKDNSISLTDNDSTNGTKVNGKLVKSLILSDGDRIQIGDAVLILTISK